MYKILTNQITEITAPVVEPLSIAEAKVHLRIDGSDSDTLINSLIKAARQWCESYLQRSLVQRTYRADVDGWAYTYCLAMPPLASVTSVKYYTDDSPQVLTTLDSGMYRADLGRGEIYKDAYGDAFPNAATRRDAVQITYVAGYDPTTDSPADLAGNVPSAIKAAMLLYIGDLFENRESTTQLKMQELHTAERLLMPYRIY